MIKLYKGDCLIESDKIESGSVDLILTDLPYGTIKNIPLKGYENATTDWDVIIDTDKIMQIANRVLRKNGKMILTAQQPFTNELINKSLPNLPFNYSMIWEKDHFANALTAKKAPLNYYEDVLVFSKNHDTEDLHPLRNYLKDCKKKSGMTNRNFNNLFSDYTNKKGNRDRSVIEHYWAPAQFCMPTMDIYKNILQPTGFFKTPYEDLLKIDIEFKQQFASTFNLWEGKKYKSNILKYKKDYSGHHPTQKPVLLLEDLIKTFSNENDNIVDLTMGSGSTGVACVNTNRNFTGIEMDSNYFKIAQERIEGTSKQLFCQK